MPKAPRSFWQSLREIDYVYWAIELAYVIAAPLAVISRHAWMLLLVFLPAWAYQHYRVRRAKLPAKRLYLGHCPDCGYDLRATRDRCPECGRVVTPAEQFQFGRNDRNEESHQEWPAWSWPLIALVVCATIFLVLPEGSGKYVLFIALVGLYCYGVWLFIGWFERRGKQRQGINPRGGGLTPEDPCDPPAPSSRPSACSSSQPTSLDFSTTPS